MKPTSWTWLAAAVLLPAALTCSKPGPAWTRYRAPDGLFSVEMPGAPTVAKTRRPTLPTVTEVTTIQVDRGAAGSLQVAHYQILPQVNEFPEGDALRIDCQHPFTDSKFIPTDPVAMTIGGHRAMSISGTAPRSDSLPHGGWEEDRCVIVGQRFYHLIAIGPDDDATRSIGKRFLDSFQPAPPR